MASIYNKVSVNLLKSNKFTINEKYIILRALFCGKYENIQIQQFQLKKTTLSTINKKLTDLGIISKTSNKFGINYSVNIEVLNDFTGDNNKETYKGYINISRALVESKYFSAGEIVVLCMLQTYSAEHCYKYYITAEELGTSDYLLRKFYKTLEEKEVIEVFNRYLTHSHTSSNGCYKVKYVRVKYKELVSMPKADLPLVASLPAAPKMEKMAYEPDGLEIHDTYEELITDEEQERMDDAIAVAMFDTFAASPPEVSFDELSAFEPVDTDTLTNRMRNDFFTYEEKPARDYEKACVLRSVSDRIAELAMKRTVSW